MGLGKTVQALALLLQVKERLDGPGAEPGAGSDAEPSLRRRASLLAAPASLLANWKAEVARFAPSLKVAFWHPSETPAETLAAWEARPEELLASHDLVVVSYAFLAKKADWFAGLQWRLAVLDEAQAVKNPASGWSRAARRLQAQGKVALTGTPVENRLLDLWSIFDFLNPGLFGSLKRFKEILASLEKRVEDQDRWGPLRRLAAPYLLRRLKTDRRVAADLPDKSEVDLNCRLTAAQATLYARVVEDLQKGLKRLQPAGGELGGESGVGVERRGLVLQALTRLRQVINHPAQLTGDGDWSSERSGKFQRLAELGRELAERQERLLVFSQFKEVIEPLAEHLRSVFGRPGLVLHGGVAVGRRRGLVEAFQAEDGPPFFVLSLKAGGVGLNLTAAGQVIHFDRWWNPAVEDQASDRAYRIGQRRNVLIHKCVTRGTLEERVDALLKKKRALADGVLGGEREIDLTGLDDGALMELVGLDLERAIL
jgi:non-specific serine/threonine protein kinase